MYYYVETVYIPDLQANDDIHVQFVKDIHRLYHRVDIYSKILMKTDNQICYVLMVSEVRGSFDEMIDHLNEVLFGQCGQTVFIKAKKIRDSDFLGALVKTSDNGFDLVTLNKNSSQKNSS